MKRILLTAVVVAGVLSGGVAAMREWRRHVLATLEERAFTQAAKSLQDRKPLDALAIADEQVRSDARFAWGRLELEALVASRHLPRLVGLYGRAPQRILAHEEASLWVARAFLAARQEQDFARVRESWQGREVRPELWLALDADVLGFEGKSSDAERMLRARKFAGESDATRLVRLALHAARRNLYESWTLLDQAFEVAPRNAEIRSFRAQILESIGKIAEARVEYVAAQVADPTNPLLRDELAEFYRRQGSYDIALQTWRDALKLPAPDFIALKEAFWSRVIQSTAKTANLVQAQGALTPLAGFIQSLPPDRFWDAEGFARLSLNDRVVRERPEIFWLQLLEHLRTGQEPEAVQQLRDNRFRSRSWRPELEVGLSRILQYRAHQTFAGAEADPKGVGQRRHPFLAEIAHLTREASVNAAHSRVPSEFAAFLRSRNAFAGACLAAGWREAALVLGHENTETEAPDWYVFGRAQSLRFNRGNAAALNELALRPRTPERVGLIGELLLAEKNAPVGIRELESIARHDSDAGYRAAWLLAQMAIESRELLRARELIQRQPRLAAAITGRELLARLSWLEGRSAEAEQMYLALASDSIEARTFLARRAFERQDWATARRQTEALQRQLPDELQLRENLLAIAKAEQAHEKP